MEEIIIIKSFSIFIKDNYIWVGTGDGINKGIINQDTNCIDWIHYTTLDGLGGDWIIDIVPQYINSENPRIWLISWDREEPAPHPNSLTYSDDNGNSWIEIEQFSEEFIDLNNNDIYDVEDSVVEDLNNNYLYDGATAYS